MRKGQITLYVIIAILIVSSVVLIVSITKPFGIPAKLMPVENKVIMCVSDAVNEGADILGEQGGYISVPAFEAGSEYTPLGNQFNFFGSMMPFWFYKSQNGIYKTQVPSIQTMSKDLESYINKKIIECDFSEFEAQGYSVTEESPKSSVSIRDREIIATVNWPVTVTFGDITQRIETHKTTVKNNLGRSYSLAKQIYDEEQNNLFLENYARDVIVLYAPGTNVELSCTPKLWSKQKVIDGIKKALEANLQTIKFAGNYYTLRNKENEYFVHNLGNTVNERVNIVYSSSFPTKVEVEPSEGNIMRADPLGLQEGLGVLGLCYLPYHFVYSVEFPVIMQIFDENDNFFQYPMMVEIKNNLPRNSTIGEQPPELETTFCDYKVQQENVQVIDSFGNPVDNATVSYKCINSLCYIGQTENGEIEAAFPQCVNGYIVANAEGYSASKLEFSTNEEGSATLIMSKLYDLDLNPTANDNPFEKDETAIISFLSPDYSTTVYYPMQNSVNLVSGTYNVSAMMFKEGTIELAKQSTEKCINVPRQDILGLFGVEREECYTIEIPTQTVSQLVVGGGNMMFAASDDELSSSSELNIYFDKLNAPKNLNELQDAYNIISGTELQIELK